jgi:hypothetical protein
MFPVDLHTVILCGLDDYTAETRAIDSFHLESKSLLGRCVNFSESRFFLRDPRSKGHFVNILTRDLVYVKPGDESKHAKAIGLQPGFKDGLEHHFIRPKETYIKPTPPSWSIVSLS